MTTDPQAEPAPPIPRAAALTALWPVLGAATVAAFLLARSHIELRYGSGVCGPLDGGCEAVARAPWAFFSGAPVSAWAPPLYVVIAMWVPAARRDDDRGRAARGGIIALAGLCMLVTVAMLGMLLTQVGLACGLCLLLALLHLAIFALALAPARPRMPAMPSVDDWLPALLIGLTVLMGSGFAGRILIGRLERAAAAAATQPELDLPADTQVGVDGLASAAIAVPPRRSPVPVDDEDPAVGTRDAVVQAVAFVDLLDADSRTLVWRMMDLEPAWDDKVRFIYKHLPMDASCNSSRKRTAHPRSCAVAVALQCAHDQGAYVRYRRMVLRNPHAVEDADLLRMAEQGKLDMQAFEVCRTGDEGLDGVEADVKQASKGELGDPPYLFVDGRVLEGAADPLLLEATLAVAVGERDITEDGMAAPVGMRVTDQPPADGPASPVQAGDVFIDPVEAARDAQGRAVAAFGAAPHPVSLDQARDACAAAGRRLCSRAEWVAACQGRAPVDDDGDGELFDDLREGRLMPYGDPLRGGWCQDGGAPGLAASAAGCRTPEGVYDLAGNLAEWVEEGLLLGGSAASGDALGCHVVEQPPGAGWRSATTGFRCCGEPVADLLPGPPQPAPQLPAAILPPSVRTAAVDAGVALDPGLVLIAWRTDCAGCQSQLRDAVAQASPVLLIDLDPDPAATAEWLSRARVSAARLPDPQGHLAGALGVPGLPWSATLGPDGGLQAR